MHPRISIVAPAHNEGGNLERLVDEVEVAGERLATMLGGPFEFVVIDDGSTDASLTILQRLQAERPWLGVVSMTNTIPGRRSGQAAALYAGFRAATGDFVATLDADLQNDPADFPRMLDLMVREDADMVQGDRSENRSDSLVRRVGSRFGRTFRHWLLGDTIRDAGCSLRIMTREIALRLPLEFRGVHRFIPVTARHMGYRVLEMHVSHRPRHAGESKYGLGTQRALPSLIDCLAVRWMRSRRCAVTSVRIGEGTSDPCAETREESDRDCELVAPRAKTS